MINPMQEMDSVMWIKKKRISFFISLL